MEIKEKIEETTLQSKRGFLKVVRRFGSVKLEQETINDLTRRIEKAFKRFSVGPPSSECFVSNTGSGSNGNCIVTAAFGSKGTPF